MSNEELILQLLTDMSEKINNIDKRTARIEMHLENVTDKNISGANLLDSAEFDFKGFNETSFEGLVLFYKV